MKQFLLVILALFAVVGTPGLTRAQRLSSELSALAEKIELSLGRDMSDWERERGKPVMKDSNVLIQYWRSPRRTVRIVVVPHGAVAEARDALQRFVEEKHAKRLPQDFGEETYSWGIDTSEMAFRKGKLTIYVSVAADTDRDPESKGLAAADKAKRREVEQQRLTKEFARHVNDSINLP